VRYFMISFKSIEISDEIKLRDFLGENGFKFWHRFPNMWIVITPDDLDVRKLTDLMDGHISGAPDYIAVEFEHSGVTASIPQSIWPWFEKNLGFEFETDDGAKGK